MKEVGEKCSLISCVDYSVPAKSGVRAVDDLVAWRVMPTPPNKLYLIQDDFILLLEGSTLSKCNETQVNVE